MFARLGSWCHARRRVVVGVWLAALLGIVVATHVVGTHTSDEVRLPNVESARGIDILKQAFGGQGAGVDGKIVFKADAGVQDPAVEAAMGRMLTGVAAIPHLTLHSPYDPGFGALQISRRGALSGKLAYATVELPDKTPSREVHAAVARIESLVPHRNGLQVELGGSPFSTFHTPHSEVIGVAFAIVILVLAFGSVLAMGLPIGMALAGIGVGITLVGLLSNVVSVPDYANQLGLMVGLGVGIDYALFIVTRFRENYHHGHTVAEATSIAIDTAGRAVAFAGITVVVSFLGMFLMGLSFVQGLAIGAAVVVSVTVVASLTLLPALLGFVGDRVEVTRWRGVIGIGLLVIGLVGVGLEISPLLVALPLVLVVAAASLAVAPLRREVRRRPVKHLSHTRWYRWSRWIQHHPWKAAISGTLLLVTLALPVLGMRLGFSDEGNLPRSTTTRRAYDLLAEGFGPGSNGQFLLTARVASSTTAQDLAPVAEAVAKDPDVEAVQGAFLNDATHPQAAVWQVIPRSAPQDAATSSLVRRLRRDVLPPVRRITGVHVVVTGGVAADVDFADYLTARLFFFFGAVLGVSFLLLMAVFRSVLVPLKAVIMNLLSIGAAYGVVVAIFQWGWLGSIVKVAPAPVEPVVPMMLFAIVFGLSMDYEVFLLSRMREEYHRTGDSGVSVANGLAATAQVITAAAAIMVFVFGSFLLETDRIVKLFGVGLAVAVLLDATIVRMLLVPATMELLGDRNWWLPRWLDRLLPTIDVEGHGDSLEAELDDAEEDDYPSPRHPAVARRKVVAPYAVPLEVDRPPQPVPRGTSAPAEPTPLDPAALARRSIELGVDGSLLSQSFATRTRLSPREQEAVRWMVALHNRCVVDDGRTRPGVDDAFRHEVASWWSSRSLSPRERLAAELAHRFTAEPETIGPQLWSRLEAAYEPAELADLLLCCGLFLGFGRVLRLVGERSGEPDRGSEVGEAEVEVGLLDAAVHLDDLPGDVPTGR